MSSTAHLALTTALGIAASYSPASLCTEFLSRTTPKPARKPFWYGGKTQQFSLVTLGRALEWYTEAGRSAFIQTTQCRFGGLQNPVYCPAQRSVQCVLRMQECSQMKMARILNLNYLGFKTLWILPLQSFVPDYCLGTKQPNSETKHTLLLIEPEGTSMARQNWKGKKAAAPSPTLHFHSRIGIMFW